MLTSTQKIKPKSNIQDESNFDFDDIELGISATNKEFLIQGRTTTSYPKKFLLSNSKDNKNSTQKTKNGLNIVCHNSKRVNTLNEISGKENSNNFSTIASTIPKTISNSSKQTFKSDSERESKNSENSFQKSSQIFTLDTPSFTEAYNDYDFILDYKEKHQTNSSFSSIHDHSRSNSSKSILDKAFCESLSHISTEEDETKFVVIKVKDCGRGNNKSKDDGQPKIRIRASKPVNKKPTQELDELETLNSKIQERKNYADRMKQLFLNKFDGEKEWIDEFRSIRHNLRDLSTKRAN